MDVRVRDRRDRLSDALSLELTTVRLGLEPLAAEAPDKLWGQAV